MPPTAHVEGPRRSLLRRHFGGRIDRLDPRGAIFEFRNLAERIERRIGENVGGRFDKGKGNEDYAVGNGVILARCQFDDAAAGRDPDRIARLDAELGDGAARHRGYRARLESVERGGAPRHGAGMPVFELAPGSEDERIVVVRRLVGRLQLGRDQFAEAAWPRETLLEHHVAARLVWRIGRISDRALAGYALPRNIVQ